MVGVLRNILSYERHLLLPKEAYGREETVQSMKIKCPVERKCHIRYGSIYKITHCNSMCVCVCVFAQAHTKWPIFVVHFVVSDHEI